MSFKAFIIQGDAERVPLLDQSVDLVLESPPYGPQRTYGISAQRGVWAWVDWMLPIIAEGCRVSRGLVLVNCAGWSEDRCYQPGPEILLAEWFKAGGQCWRPVYWHRVGIPGSGGKQWLRADIEYVLAFKRDAEWLAWSDNTANGAPPKQGGGGFTNRTVDGQRVTRERPDWLNPFGRQASSVGRRANGERKPPYFNGNGCRDAFGFSATSGNVRYPSGEAKPIPPRRLERGNEKGSIGPRLRAPNGKGPTGEPKANRSSEFPVKANPGNLIQGIPVGGGKMGHPLAHENEAPFPVRLAEWLIRGWCPPGGIVLDRFGGSGTTADAALRMGRNAITMDLRWSQCELTRRRLASPVDAKPRRVPKPEPAQPSLFGETV